MDKPLYALSLEEASAGIRSRRFTCVGYTEALLARIASLDESIQAWVWIEPEEALKAARRCDERLDAGAEPRPLEGLPVGVKDIFATAGIPTQMGTPAFAGHVPAESAEVIRRLEAGGGFVMGKTVTTECAFLSPGATRNPWNLRHTPGGSSSGSAAAVAAGFVPAALGTQTNGSVIRPAAFCGVVGFKPTQGLVPITGALTFSHTLDQPGVLARSVRDAAGFAAALSSDGAPLLPAMPVRGTPPRLAAVRTPVWGQAEEHAQRMFAENIAALRKGGVSVEERELPDSFALAHRAIRTIMAVEAAFNLEALQRDKAPLLSPTLKEFLVEGQGHAAPAYLQALKVRRDLMAELAGFLAPYDALVTPPTTGEAPATLEQTGNPVFCSIWSLCGVPAVTIPVGLGPRGLPLGLQFVGTSGGDGRVLCAAHWCEELFAFSPFISR